ncbi:hypothetical protein J6590_098789 [Homalodisca vitripennis]|nr:hypothetical protein J6590_098789 [Homalodisca vitripennis]
MTESSMELTELCEVYISPTVTAPKSKWWGFLKEQSASTIRQVSQDVLTRADQRNRSKIPNNSDYDRQTPKICVSVWEIRTLLIYLKWLPRVML